MLYGYVGQTIKNLISGTIWDIPEKEEFTEDDKEFVLDCIYSEYDASDDYMNKASDMIDKSKTLDHSRGYILRIPVFLFEDEWNYMRIDYNSDFFRLLESHFGGVFILEEKWREFYKFCLPFYK
jgi:hypothetical protein